MNIQGGHEEWSILVPSLILRSAVYLAFGLARCHSQSAMIITMISMRVMELSLIEIIHVIAMWNGLMSTFAMSTCTIRRGTTIRILATHEDDMFIIVSFMGRVQMTLMQVVEMIVMLDCRMPTMLTVDMGVLRMNVMTHY